MRGARGKQGDLFATIEVTALRPELRSRLAPLLQALLAEAAKLGPQQAASDDLGNAEAGDDQDHG
ncbi:MAG TPA: hypothetical protein VME45_07785 [Stellaceae bacterium]|nr:hypothetical protein [Stellaceae bacterium]